MYPVVLQQGCTGSFTLTINGLSGIMLECRKNKLYRLTTESNYTCVTNVS